MAEIKCTTVEKIGILNEGKGGWSKELRLVSWNGTAPKLDIRTWAPDNEKAGKGVTLTEDEARVLMSLLEKYFG